MQTKPPRKAGRVHALLRQANAALCRVEASLESPATRHKAYVQLMVAEAMVEAARQARGPRHHECRVCGCTDIQACPGGCRWVEPDLCSACEVAR